MIDKVGDYPDGEEKKRIDSTLCHQMKNVSLPGTKKWLTTGKYLMIYVNYHMVSLIFRKIS